MIDLSDERDLGIAWACLWAQIEDVHAPVWNLTKDDARRAVELCESIPDDGPPEDRVLAKALAYFAYDVDHLLMDDDEMDAGAALLAELDDTVNLTGDDG